jgi:hypothetical protein
MRLFLRPLTTVFTVAILVFNFNFSFAQQTAESIIISEKAVIHSQPDENSDSKGFIRRGRKIRTFGENGDYLKIRLKNGETGYILKSDAEPREAEVEGAEGGEAGSRGEADFKRWNIQIGASSGSSLGRSYTEANVGVGYYFYRWLEFYNAFFARLNSQPETLYGLDSSLRLVFKSGVGSVAHIHLFGGPGYRIATNSEISTLFTEFGVIGTLAGFSLGGSLKTFYYQMRDGSRSNENQYSIILAGSSVF